MLGRAGSGVARRPQGPTLLTIYSLSPLGERVDRSRRFHQPGRAG